MLQTIRPTGLRSGVDKDRPERVIKMKNPAAPAVKREAGNRDEKPAGLAGVHRLKPVCGPLAPCAPRVCSLSKDSHCESFAA